RICNSVYHKDEGVLDLSSMLLDHRGRTGVLPDDRPAQRVARTPVPQHGRLALVGDPDGGDLLGADIGVRERLRYHALEGVPDLDGVVLDPSGPGEVLLVLVLGDRHQPTAVVEEDAPGGGGALVYGHH